MEISTDNDQKYFDGQLLTYLWERKNAEALSILQEVENLRGLTDSSGATLLHYAAKYSNATMAQYLIDRGCEIDALDESRRSPLMLAVSKGCTATIELLLAANANVDLRDALGRTVLESVLQSGIQMRSSDVVGAFLNRVKDACSNDDQLIAYKLLEVDCPLVKAISLNRSEVTRIMLKNGCSVNDLDSQSRDTALHKALELMDLKNIQVLVQHGADVNAKGELGRTALFKYNVKLDDTDVKLAILRLLLERGASLTVQDHFGMSPLTLLFSGGDQRILQIVMQYDVDLSAYNRFQQTPLHYLVDNRNPGVIEAIRGKNFDVDARDLKGFTGLLLAAKNYDVKNVEFLLEQGANVNAKSVDGHTPLILVFMNRLEEEANVSEIIELLLQHGADAEVSIKSRITIFDLALQNNFFFRIKAVIAHLAMLEARGQSLTQLIRDKIHSNYVFKYHFEKCKDQLRKMRYQIVHGSVSLFKLLFECENKLVLYARNEDFDLKFKRSIAHFIHLDKYILNTLKKRVAKAVQVAKFNAKAVFAICQITGLPISTCHTIAYKIVDYLGYSEIQNLYQF